MDAFRDQVVAQHDTNHVNLVFNNAGIAGGGSFITSEPKEWDRTFGVCWGGVYNGCRSFLPLLIASDSGYLVNVKYEVRGPLLYNLEYIATFDKTVKLGGGNVGG